MNIISKNNIVPSERLIEKYKSSKQSEKLNLPDFDYLKSKIGISQEKYEYIKEQLKSLNQNIVYSCPNKITKIQSLSFGIKYLYIGQINEQDKTKSGIGVFMSSEGDYYHCFWSDDLPCYQGVMISSEGDCYEGILDLFDSIKFKEEAKHLRSVKGVFLGDFKVGKSCLLHKLETGEFNNSSYLPTIGVDFKVFSKGEFKIQLYKINKIY